MLSKQLAQQYNFFDNKHDNQGDPSTTFDVLESMDVVAETSITFWDKE